jgi:hypothetical protein
VVYAGVYAQVFALHRRITICSLLAKVFTMTMLVDKLIDRYKGKATVKARRQWHQRPLVEPKSRVATELGSWATQTRPRPDRNMSYKNRSFDYRMHKTASRERRGMHKKPSSQEG